MERPTGRIIFSVNWAKLVRISPTSDHWNAGPLQQNEKKSVTVRKIPLFGLLLLCPLCACLAAIDVPVEPTLPVQTGCGANGRLQTVLFGSIQATVDWSAARMKCQSMRRPHDSGIRLRFEGEVAGEQLALIISIPDMQPGKAAVELRSNVTTTVKGSGRFFSTPNLDSCWTDIDAQTALSDTAHTYQISGRLYCLAPLGEVNAQASVSIPNLSFTTIVAWE